MECIPSPWTALSSATIIYTFSSSGLFGDIASVNFVPARWSNVKCSRRNW